MLTIEQAGTRVTASPGCAATRHFETHDWVRIPGLLGAELLARVQAGMQVGSFIPSAEQTGHGPVRRLLMAPDATAALLDLCFNDPVLFRAVEAITGCAALRFFAGSVYRLTAARGDVPWHDDCVDGRRVAMTMTLAPEAYDGGVLQLRERDGHEIRDVPNPGPGDAILFRIHPSLQHRNTPLTSGTKTAFAGWFGDGPSLARRLRSATAEGVQ